MQGPFFELSEEFLSGFYFLLRPYSHFIIIMVEEKPQCNAKHHCVNDGKLEKNEPDDHRRLSSNLQSQHSSLSINPLFPAQMDLQGR